MLIQYYMFTNTFMLYLCKIVDIIIILFIFAEINQNSDFVLEAYFVEILGSAPALSWIETNLFFTQLSEIFQFFTNLFLFQSVDKSIEQLETLGAISQTQNGTSYSITELGKKMAAFPVDPRMSKTLISAHANGCL